MTLTEIEQMTKDLRDSRLPDDAAWLADRVLELIEKVRAQDIELGELREEIVDLTEELRLANESGERSW